MFSFQDDDDQRDRDFFDRREHFGGFGFRRNGNRRDENRGACTESSEVRCTGYNKPIPIEREEDGYRGQREITQFGWNLFKKSNTQDNYVLSPLSPQILLSYLAWVADGQTRNEIVKGAGFGHPNEIQRIVRSLLSDGKGRTLQLATAFFVSQDLKLNQEFLNEASKGAEVVEVDFKKPEEAARTVKNWATQKTKGGLKIDDISFTPSTKVSLTSAVYFKGNWVYTFQPAVPGVFHAPGGDIQVQMMNQKRKYRWGKIRDIAEWAAMPYESQDSLVIILPNEGQKIDDVIEQITHREIDDIMYNMGNERSNADVNFTLPKFTIESTTNLVEPYQKVSICLRAVIVFNLLTAF